MYTVRASNLGAAYPMGFTSQELADDPLPMVNDENRQVRTVIPFDADGRTVMQSHQMASFQFRVG
jgi:hypothetical protein